MARFDDTIEDTIVALPSTFQFHGRFGRIQNRLREDENLLYALDELREEIAGLFHAEQFEIYERSADGREIVSLFKSLDDGEVSHVGLTPTSVVGYVATNPEPIRLDNVLDPEERMNIHPRLEALKQKSLDGKPIVSVIAVPIVESGETIGVFQVLNKIGDTFSDQDLVFAGQMGETLGSCIRMARVAEKGPFQSLLEREVITSEQLAEAESAALSRGRSVAFILEADMGVPKAEIGESLEQFYMVPFMGYNEDVALPTGLLETLNLQFLVRNRWVPVSYEDSRVVILIDDPNDANRIMEIQRIVQASSFDFMVGTSEDIMLYLGVEVSDEIANIETPKAELAELVVRLGEEFQDIEDDDKTSGGELVDENAATVIQLVNRLISDAVDTGASDIHVEPNKGDKNGTVRMRIDGICREVLEIPADYVRFVIARIKIMSKVDIAETRLPQDGKITCRLYGSPLELRVATIPTVNGESVVMRVLAAGDPLPFDKLNLMPRNMSEISQMLEHPHGIVLVVGPTGSGKTTTLHALLGRINTPERKILTAEDPVEITQPGLQQVQVRSNIGLDFARVLRAFLRADPDVILIGEMRDYETAHSGIEASLTGHLVFSTLHTNSAPETITRLLDMGLDPLNFSDALIGVLAQRLVRTLCPKCKEAYTPDNHDIEQLINAYGPEYFPELGINEADLLLYRPVGCENCGGTGYRGRTGIHELLAGTEEMKEMIVKKEGAARIHALAVDQGMRTLLQDGIAKVFRGETDFKQVRAVTIA